jgi:hypothetical protein
MELMEREESSDAAALSAKVDSLQAEISKLDGENKTLRYALEESDQNANDYTTLEAAFLEQKYTIAEQQKALESFKENLSSTLKNG